MFVDVCQGYEGKSLCFLARSCIVTKSVCFVEKNYCGQARPEAFPQTIDMHEVL